MPVYFYFLTFFAVFTGTVIQSTAGFASGMVSVLVLSLVMPVLQAAGLSTIFGTTLCAIMAYRYRKYICFKIALPTVPMYLIFSTVALYIALKIDVSSLKAYLGIFLVILAIYFAFFTEKIRIKGGLKAGLICGSASGLLSGLFGLGGPPMALYFLSVSNNKKETYIANMQIVFMINGLYITTLRFVNGIIPLNLLLLLIPGMAAMFLGRVVGSRIVERINIEMMRKIVFSMIAASGVITFAMNI